MPRFAYEAADAAGRPVRGVQLADSTADLDRILSTMDLVLIDSRTERARLRRRLPPQLLIDFCYHLQSAVEAGIPLIDAIGDFSNEPGSVMGDLMSDVTRKVRNGAQLSEALDDHPGQFPELMRALMRAGEQTGKLDVVLRDLARYLEWRDQLGHQIKSALAYPCVVILGIVALMAIMVGYVLPNFLKIFQELDVEMPAMAANMLALSDWSRAHVLELAVGVVVVPIALVLAVRTEAGKRLWHTALLRAPLLGRLVLMLEMSRFSHNLAVLYSAGIPIVDALRMVREIVQNVRIRAVLDEARTALSGGGSLTEALRRDQLVPSLVLRMISIGESSGRLDQSLERASAYYDRELPRLIGKCLAVFNTLSVVLLGAALALIATSIFVPMYQMLGEINAG